MLTAENIILTVSGLLLSLITGLFYSYSCSVNPGLGRLNDAEYVKAMQSINSAIQNPVFFISFLGTLIMLPVSAWLIYKSGGNDFYFVLAACIIYTVMVFGLTMIGNMPLNNRLAGFKTASASGESVSAARMDFEARWNRYHQIRTVSCVTALVLFLLALITR